MSFTPDSQFVDDVYISPNIGERNDGLRPTILVMHYTGLESLERSIRVLADPACEVSCHYVIDTDGRTIQMVSESMRAWHAGVSYWQGATDINSMSIGIEIQNPGHEAGYPDFPEVQMQAVEELSRDIVSRHRIAPSRVLAHSDIAPKRKIDPGEKFDWKRLAHAGVGLWVAPTPAGHPLALPDPERADTSIAQVQRLLAIYGYQVGENGRLDEPTRKTIAAFQRHFRPERVDGLVDLSTLTTLRRLVAKIA